MTTSAPRLSDLLKRSELQPLRVIGNDPPITGACLDSRRVRPGDLFFAIRGFETDGESFVADAVERGARAVVAESPRPDGLAPEIAWVQVEEPRKAAGLLSRECHGRPDEALTLVGITGTNGKTTVAHLVESIGKAAGLKCGRIGTVGSSLDGEERPLAHTTPEAPDFYGLLAEMRDRTIDLVAMEVSSHALALSRVEGARFRVGAFLNLSPDHLDFHRNESDYFEAKARLFDSLRPDATAVLPADSPLGDRLRERTAARTLTFGRSDGADVRLSEEHGSLEGSSAVLTTPSGALPIRTFLLGRPNLDNIAAAAACALALELPAEAIPAGVLALEGIAGRMERVEAGQAFTVLVDYAHTPAALESLLGWLREVVPGRVLVVFGCGGDRDREKRPLMGRTAALAADLLYLTSDNPRGEDPEQILDAIERGVDSVDGARRRCRRVPDREEAIREALSAARRNDVVVIAGKGHETVQVAGGRTLAFDDRRVARRVLEERHAGA